MVEDIDLTEQPSEPPAELFVEAGEGVYLEDLKKGIRIKLVSKLIEVKELLSLSLGAFEHLTKSNGDRIPRGVG